MEDKEYREKNICPMCNGEIYIKGHRKGNIKCVCEDGTYIGYLVNWEIYLLKENHERLKKDHTELQNWVKKTSNCKTCGGDQMKTLGLVICNECGIPGKGYWPG